MCESTIIAVSKATTHYLYEGPFLTKKIITIRDLFVVNRDFFVTIHDMIFFGFSSKKLSHKSVCEKKHSTNNSFELDEGQIHSGITLTVFAMSESPK